MTLGPATIGAAGCATPPRALTALARVGRLFVASALALCAWPAAGGAEAMCRQALVFALDVSGSVDAAEYRQQLVGIAGALQDPDVQAAILADADVPMAVAAFEWSSASYSTLIADWTMLHGEADVAQFADRLRSWPRRSAPRTTGIGAGLKVAAALLRRAPDCWEMTVDLSADGPNNDGPPPRSVHEEGLLAGATVNALLVGGGPEEDEAAADLEEMERYLRENVVAGPGSFVAVAQTYDDYSRAMRRKLLMEIAAVPNRLVPLAPETR
jgi:hypothetical protein